MNSVKSNSGGALSSGTWCAPLIPALGEGHSEFHVSQGSTVRAFPRNKQTKIHSTPSILLAIHLEMEL